MEFFQILWYLVLLSVAAAVPIPQHIQMNQILGWTAVAISACFGIHDQAFIVVRVLGSLLYHAWDEARMVFKTLRFLFEGQPSLRDSLASSPSQTTLIRMTKGLLKTPKFLPKLLMPRASKPI
jgi:hypothetical protein